MPENQFGQHLKKLRKSHNYTQEYVASCLNIIRQSYSHYETGRTTPNIETLKKLADLYQVPLQTLLGLQLDPSLTIEEASQHMICSNINAQELQLLTSFRKLSLQDQQDIIDFIKIKLERV